MQLIRSVPPEGGCREILLAGASTEALSLCNRLGHEVIGVCDPKLTGERTWKGIPAYTEDTSAIEHHRGIDVAVAIDEPAIRKRTFSKLKSLGVRLISLVGGRLGCDVEADEGLFMQQLSNLSEGSRVGKGLRLNIGANVMHDASIGDFVTIAPNATVLGRVTIMSDTYIGAGAVILPDLTIGAGSLIGAGAVVTRPVRDNTIVKGVPAR